ncbi:MAG TPA: PCRF domain-containing protein, partial [Gammaproteobacteria bacterium]|nr:PCRF domain-containing protein [Gammaproteobacteria bacterium]
MFDLDNKQAHFNELTEKLNDPKLWEDPKKAQELNKERVHLEKELKAFIDLAQAIKDASELSELALSEKDEEALVELVEEIENNEKKLYQLEFQRMFSNPMDPNNAFLDIQS